MVKYIISRLIAMCITLFLIVTIAFCTVRLMPGNVYDDPTLPKAIVDIMRAKHHLDDPILVQYFYFIKGIIVNGDWGTSIKIEPSVPAFQVIRSRIPITMTLNLFALFLSIPLGIGFGIWAALKRNTLTDHTISVLIMLGISIPSFVIASMMQYFIAFKAGIFPIVYQPSATGFAWFHSMMLPIIALTIGPIATIARYLRAELIDTLNSEFMLLARTKGLSRPVATVRHALRNSFIPLTSIVIGQFAGLMGGSLVIEKIYSIPGVGGIMVKSINGNDYTLTIAVLIFYSVVDLVASLVIDLAYGVVDPRIRMGGKKEA